MEEVLVFSPNANGKTANDIPKIGFQKPVTKKQ